VRWCRGHWSRADELKANGGATTADRIESREVRVRAAAARWGGIIRVRDGGCRDWLLYGRAAAWRRQPGPK
jgi:hypothetical protein